MSNRITVGRVTQRKHAKLHTATCRIVSYRHLIPTTIRPLTSDDAPRVCGHCRPILFAVALEAAATARMRAGNSTEPNGAQRARVAEGLAAALESDAHRLDRLARDEAFRAQYRQLHDVLTLAA